jgi:hypothetical protein
MEVKKISFILILLISCILLSCSHDNKQLSPEQQRIEDVKGISEVQSQKIDLVSKALPGLEDVKTKLIDRTIEWNHHYIWWYVGCFVLALIAWFIGGMFTGGIIEDSTATHSKLSAFIAWLFGGWFGLHRIFIKLDAGYSAFIITLPFIGICCIIKPIYIFGSILINPECLWIILHANVGFWLIVAYLCVCVIEVVCVICFNPIKQKSNRNREKFDSALWYFVHSLSDDDNNYDCFVDKNIRSSDISRLKYNFEISDSEKILLYRDHKSYSDFCLTTFGIYFKWEQERGKLLFDQIDKIDFGSGYFQFYKNGRIVYKIRTYDVLKENGSARCDNFCRALSDYIRVYPLIYKSEIGYIVDAVKKRHEYRDSIEKYIKDFRFNEYAIMALVESLFDLYSASSASEFSDEILELIEEHLTVDNQIKFEEKSFNYCYCYYIEATILVDRSMAKGVAIDIDIKNYATVASNCNDISLKNRANRLLKKIHDYNSSDNTNNSKTK